MMDLRYSPYQRKKTSRKAKATTVIATRPRSEGLRWTCEEDSLLRDGVCKFGGKKWKTISEHLERRSPEECNKRWNKLQSLDSVVKRPWAQEEDAQMFQLVKKYGASKWAVIASYLTGRNGKQCRERWHNQLNPLIKKTPWTEEENAIILDMQAKFGNCWAKITSQLPGRTDNAVKNHWHSSLKNQANRARGECGTQAVKRTKSKKKLCKAKSIRSTMKRSDSFFLCVDFPDCEEDATGLIEIPGCAAEDADAIDTPDYIADAIDTPDYIADSPMIESLDSVVDLFGTPIIHEDDSGSLSPDVVSSVDNLDPYTYAHSYREDVLRAQAVIDNILDPMGMECCLDSSLIPLSLPDVCVSQATANNFKQKATDGWCLNNDTLSADPMSPAQSPFGLDELLCDSLSDVGGEDAVEETSGVDSSGLILSAPLGEVARVYKRSALASEWGSCVTYASPITLTTEPVLTPNLPYVAPPLSLIDQTVGMHVRPKDEFLGDGVNHELLSQESGYAQHFSALSSLLDVEF